MRLSFISLAPKYFSFANFLGLAYLYTFPLHSPRTKTKVQAVHLM